MGFSNILLLTLYRTCFDVMCKFQPIYSAPISTIEWIVKLFMMCADQVVLNYFRAGNTAGNVFR